jgi:hypothetical protein
MTLVTGVVRRLTVRHDEIARLARGLVTNRTLGFGVRRVAEPDPERLVGTDLGMALPAIREIVRSESTATVVARRATVRLHAMHRDVDRRHPVPRLSVVAAVTRNARVFGVIEVEPDRRDRIDDGVSRPEFVTGRALPDIVFRYRLSGGMALKTARVRVATGGNGHSGTLCPVAGRAVGFVEMRLVIEPDAEAADRRERFELLGSLTFVADDADGVRRVVELRSVASGARNVGREAYLSRIIVALMAKQTWQILVTRTVVFEFCKIHVLHRVGRTIGLRYQRLIRAFTRDLDFRLRTRRRKIADGKAKERENDHAAHEHSTPASRKSVLGLIGHLL